MRVVCTGQSGLGKLQYLTQVKNLLKEEPEKELAIFSVGQAMQQEHEEAFKKQLDIDRILDLPLSRLTLLRRCALKDVIASSKSLKNCILDTHAVFRWRWGLFPAIDVDQIEEFDPDFFVTLIDDADEIKERLAGKRWEGFSLKDIMVWREEEILATDMIAKVVTEKKRREVPNYILARGHSPRVLEKLIFHNELRKVYLSFGITGLTRAEQEEVRNFRHRMSELFIGFDPYKIEERGLKIQKGTVEDEVYGLLAEDPFRECIEQCTRKLEEVSRTTSEDPEKIWLPPTMDIVRKNLVQSVYFSMRRERKEREDEIAQKSTRRNFGFGEVAEIDHDIDGQILSRDFRLIDQSDMLVAFIGLDQDGRPVISAGSQSEIKYALDSEKEVYIICKGKDRLSPWVTEMARGVFDNVDSTIDNFKSQGYVR